MDPLRSIFGEDGDVLADPQFQLLLAPTMLVAMGVALISPILESLTGPFGVSSTAVGQLVAVYVAPGIVVIPLIGLLADRYGRKPPIVAGLLLFGIAGSAIAFTSDFQVALGLRFLQGLGWASLSPMVITALGDLYSGTREATAQGLRFTGVGAAQALVPPVAGVLVVVGWQYPFLLYAIAIPSSLAIWVFFEEPTSIGSAPTGRADTNGGFGTSGQLRTLATFASRPRVFGVLLARQVPTFAWYALVTYNSVLVVSILGGSPGLAGTLIAAASAAKAAAATQVGRAMALFARRVDFLLLVHVLLAAGLVVSGFASSFLWVGVGFVAIGLGLGFTMAVYRSVITSLAPEHLRGGIVGVSETWGRVTATSAPVLMAGAVVVLEATMGTDLAVRWTIVGVGLGGVVVAVLALLVAIRSPAVSDEQTID